MVDNIRSGYVFDGGVGDILTIYDNYVLIKHTGVLNFFAMGIKGDKTIYYSDLTAVQFKKAGLLAGHIQFSLLGGRESVGGVLAASSDENTITFNQSSNDAAAAVVDFINQKLREIKTASKSPISPVQQTSPADEIKKFKELLDTGAITQEEFDAKKKQILGL